MEPFASPDKVDPKLRKFLDEACEKLCEWLAETGSLSPLPKLNKFPNIEIPYKGLSSEFLLKDLEILMQGAYRPSHPGALAHLDPPPLTSSIVADLITAGLNNNLLASELSPSFSKLEKELCEWFAIRLGMPPDSGGGLASGGTITNLMALVIARRKAGLENDSSAVFFASSDAHVSLVKACRIMGLADDSLRRISINKSGQISLESLHKDLEMLRKEGRKCFAVVATAGTTVRGAIDLIPELSSLCLSEGLWLHVDGAIGGVFGLIRSTAELVKGIGLADSVSLNPQKLLGVAKTSSLLLVADRLDLVSTFATDLPYVEPAVGDDYHCGEMGLQGTRSADVLKLWLGMRQLGEEGIQSLLEGAINRRIYFEKMLDCSRFQVASGPLHLIAFTPKDVEKEYASSWSVRTRQILLKKDFMLSRPFYCGRNHLKAVFGNPHTSRVHLEEICHILNNSLTN